MKLREYLDRLNEMVFDNPDCLDYDVIISADPDDCRYEDVCFSPKVGMKVDDGYGFCDNKEEWDEDQEFTYEGKEDRDDYKPDSICLN